MRVVVELPRVRAVFVLMAAVLGEVPRALRRQMRIRVLHAAERIFERRIAARTRRACSRVASIQPRNRCGAGGCSKKRHQCPTPSITSSLRTCDGYRPANRHASVPPIECPMIAIAAQPNPTCGSDRASRAVAGDSRPPRCPNRDSADAGAARSSCERWGCRCPSRDGHLTRARAIDRRMQHAACDRATVLRSRETIRRCSSSLRALARRCAGPDA